MEYFVMSLIIMLIGFSILSYYFSIKTNGLKDLEQKTHFLEWKINNPQKYKVGDKIKIMPHMCVFPHKLYDGNVFIITEITLIDMEDACGKYYWSYNSYCDKLKKQAFLNI